MKRREVRELIPVALQELHDAGFERVYADELGKQITIHEESYLLRRGKLRSTLGRIGLNIPELPGGNMRLGPYKLYRSLGDLEQPA